jgi:hypothetical protein
MQKSTYCNEICDNYDLLNVNIQSELLNQSFIGNVKQNVSMYTTTSSSVHSCRTYLFIPGVFYICVGSSRINRIGFDIPSTVAIKDKDILNITAHIIAFPKPEIYWQFGQNGSYMNVSSGITNSFNINRQSSNLVKRNFTEENFGTYSVYAYNGVGSTHYLLHSVVVVPAST